MYQVIQNSNFFTFVKEVESAQKTGWQCQGGLVIHKPENVEADTYLYMQAMVKADEKQVL